MNLDLLAVGAHPDDVELCCGGWLALASSRGQAVGIVDLSRGELATNGTPEVRAAEAADAARILGVRVRENLGLPDGGIDPGDGAALATLVAVLRRLRPTLLLAPHEVARHPDHAGASALAERATFFAGLAKYRPDLGLPHRPRRITYPERMEARPDFVVDVSAVYATKAAAVAAHASQMRGPTPTILTSAADVFTLRDRTWGASIGVAYGEPYVLGGPVPLSDPLAHFSAHPASPLWGPLR